MKKIAIAFVASFAFSHSMTSYAKDVLVCKGNGDGSVFKVCLKNGYSQEVLNNISSVFHMDWNLIIAFRNNESDVSMQFSYIFEK